MITRDGIYLTILENIRYYTGVKFKEDSCFGNVVLEAPRSEISKHLIL